MYTVKTISYNLGKQQKMQIKYFLWKKLKLINLSVLKNI